MKFSEFPVKRPVTIVMMMLIIVVLSAISLSRLAVDLMPQIKFPNLSIITTYTGVAPEEIEKSLTRPLESAIRSAPGIKNVNSVSYEGVSAITAEFPWGTNLDEASAAVRDRIGMIKKYLPDGADEPLVLKIDISQMPVLFIGMSGTQNASEIKRLAEDEVVPKLERVDGVASVTVSGGRDREIQVYVDKDRLLASGLSLDQLIMRIGYENLNVSAGNLNTAQQQFAIRGLGEFKNVDEIKNLTVGFKSGVPIYLKDIARVEDALADVSTSGQSRVNQKPGVTIIATKTTDANTVQVAARLKKALQKIRQDIPKGVNIDVVFDMSEMISDSINHLKRSAVEGAVLAIIIIFLFLFSIRPTLIVSLSIPLSLMLAFVGMYFGKMTINIMTLGGLVIALGRLVDDSIVVMENIFRHLRMGKSPARAAIDGSSEVSTAVISSTLVTVVVFLPIVFATGIAGQLFSAFGATVFFSLLASLIIAFTVVPMFSSRLYTVGRSVSDQKEKGFYPAIREFYGKALDWCLRRKKTVFSAAGLIIIVTLFFFAKTGKEFMPRMDMGMYQIQLNLPRGSSLEATSALIERLENRFTALPDVDRVTSMIIGSGSSARMGGSTSLRGVSDARIMVRMARDKKRVTTYPKLVAMMREEAALNPNVKITMPRTEAGLFGTEHPIEIKIYGDDLGKLKQISDELKGQLNAVNGLKDLATSVEEGLPEISFSFYRDRVAGYGLTAGQVSNTVANAVDGKVASLYREMGREINIRVRFDTLNLKNLNDIKDIPIATPLGISVPLRDMAAVSYGEGPSMIQRENAKRMVVISADLLVGYSLSKVAGAISGVLKKYDMPQGYFYDFGGEQQSMRETFSSLMFVLLLAILLVYMILASLYESLIHPLTIMVSIPFAFTGAIFALFISGTTLNTTSFIGLIMLVGIVSTNAIVLIDFVLKNRERGMSRHEAVVDAGKVRLRPILMTAIATLFAMIPIALGGGQGFNIQQSMGVAVVGGLFSSTFLTLIVVPCVYEIFDSLDVKVRGWIKRKPNSA
jgi:hydrophobic/amphiphilic exporter-1 (mainly G- bacteria), HAE1 family